MNYILKHENTTRYYELKTGAKWMPGGEQGDDASARLAADLAAKYIGRATYIKQIKRTNNYNGTQTYIVTYDNNVRSIYITNIY